RMSPFFEITVRLQYFAGWGRCDVVIGYIGKCGGGQLGMQNEDFEQLRLVGGQSRRSTVESRLAWIIGLTFDFRLSTFDPLPKLIKPRANVALGNSELSRQPSDELLAAKGRGVDRAGRQAAGNGGQNVFQREV